MQATEPLYNSANTNPAFQLNWSVSLFAKVDIPSPDGWLTQLRSNTEQDGVRILKFRVVSRRTVQFLASTLPEVAPAEIVRSLKGRCQYLVRDQHPRLFRRNYHVVSVGEANANVLDNYIAKQTSRHPMADPGVQERLQLLQLHNPDVDLSRVSTGNYGHFINNLQVVIENADGWHEIRQRVLSKCREMIIRTSQKKDWRLSRIGILSDHIHVLLGAGVTDSPAQVALSLMNNLAHAMGMRPVFRYSYYVGTFGPYDRGVIRR